MRLTPDELLIRMTNEYPALASRAYDLKQAYETVKKSFSEGGKLLLCGSAADCGRIAGELMKGFLLKRPIPKAFAAHSALEGEGRLLQGSLPAIALTGQLALTAAYDADTGASMAFAQQVYGYGLIGDVLLGISASGNDADVCSAMRVARAKGMRLIGLTGRGGGRLKELCDVCVTVPADEAYRVQEYHLPVSHTLCAMLEAAFFEE